MDSLGVVRPRRVCVLFACIGSEWLWAQLMRVTEHINEIVTMCHTLADTGHNPCHALLALPRTTCCYHCHCHPLLAAIITTNRWLLSSPCTAGCHHCHSLLGTGKAYEHNGTLWFDTAAHGEQYGKMAPPHARQARPTTEGDGKRDERDFALWKVLRGCRCLWWLMRCCTGRAQ